MEGMIVPINIGDFRFGAIPTPTLVAPPTLGPLAAFTGTFVGSGFNVIFRPQNAASPTPLPTPQPGSDNILQLNLTTEILEFSAPLGLVPNRGSAQEDIFLNGVPYMHRVIDVTDPASTPVGIHFEPGIWVVVPPTSDPPESGQTLARMASIPHGTTINAVGAVGSVTPKPPKNFPTVDIKPFPIGQPEPQNRLGPAVFPSLTVANSGTARIPQNLTDPNHPIKITQGMLDNPTSILAAAITNQQITQTTHIYVDFPPRSEAPAVPGGGLNNIGFLTAGPGPSPKPNADAREIHADFWIEKLANGQTQIQYLQTVILNFNTLSWPHVSVATLIQ
jgi:hypothetical protein